MSTVSLGLKWLDRLKGLFKYGEEILIACDCTHEEKIIFEGFT